MGSWSSASLDLVGSPLWWMRSVDTTMALAEIVDVPVQQFLKGEMELAKLCHRQRLEGISSQKYTGCHSQRVLTEFNGGRSQVKRICKAIFQWWIEQFIIPVQRFDRGRTFIWESTSCVSLFHRAGVSAGRSVVDLEPLLAPVSGGSVSGTCFSAAATFEPAVEHIFAENCDGKSSPRDDEGLMLRKVTLHLAEKIKTQSTPKFVRSSRVLALVMLQWSNNVMVPAFRTHIGKEGCRAGGSSGPFSWGLVTGNSHPLTLRHNRSETETCSWNDKHTSVRATPFRKPTSLRPRSEQLL